MMHVYNRVASLLFLGAMLLSCSNHAGDAVISGNVSNASEDSILLQTERIHYKFARPELISSKIDNDGNFSFTISTDSAFTAKLIYRNETYPVYVSPGRKTTLNINEAYFPNRVQASGFGSSFYNAYNTYLEEQTSADRHLRNERARFIRAEENNYLNTQRLRVQMSKEYLADTPFAFIISKNIGEYLVARLEEIRIKKGNKGFNKDLARRSVLNEALFLDFFSYKSLRSQRAGIRDFAHNWVQTFGIENRIKNDNNTDLIAGSWIRAAGDEVRNLKLNLLEYIEDEDALAHAAMYLIAEEIGDYDYQAGLNLKEKFDSLLHFRPEYHTFITNLIYEVGRTQPGNPAIDFSIPNQLGEAVNLKDFRGKYILLDFWASWCLPCIDEMPYIEEIYNTFDRSDVEIVSLSLEESRELWYQALDRFPKPWVQLYDDAAFEQQTFQAYRAGGIPFYVLIGRDGTIIRNNDFRPSGNLSEILDDLLFSDFDHAYAGGR